MFLSKENLILGENNKYVQVGNTFDKSEVAYIDICAVKTTLFPSIKLSTKTMVKCPRAVKREDGFFLKNQYVNVEDIDESDLLYIPKLESLSSSNFPSILAWLYGKYIVNGYCKSSNGIIQVIIPVRKMSEKESKRILNLDGTFIINSNTEDFSKIIISNNISIIDMFTNLVKAKSIKTFMLEASKSLYNTFLHSILIECDENNMIKIENIALAHELFINTYSKLNRVLKIIEIRKNAKKKSSKTKKTYYIKFADADDYDIIGNNLYAKVLQNRSGKNTSGIDILKNDIYDTEMVCNSIVVKPID